MKEYNYKSVLSRTLWRSALVQLTARISRSCRAQGQAYVSSLYGQETSGSSHSMMMERKHSLSTSIQKQTGFSYTEKILGSVTSTSSHSHISLAETVETLSQQDTFSRLQVHEADLTIHGLRIGHQVLTVHLHQPVKVLSSLLLFCLKEL